jgi:nicotinate-nucleotide adenylyltransferase
MDRGIRRGVMGGTFDPVHEGHLAMARRAREALGLDRVELMPCFDPPHKSLGEITPAADRLAMVALACGGDPGLVASSREIRRRGTSYTVETLREMRGEHPADELFFLMGADSLEELGTWVEPEEIVRLARVIVLNRPGHALDTPPPFLEGKVVRPGEGDGEPGEAWILEMPPAPVSSTAVRRAAAAGEALTGLVPPAVAEYIEKCGLYREPRSR